MLIELWAKLVVPEHMSAVVNGESASLGKGLGKSECAQLEAKSLGPPEALIK